MSENKRYQLFGIPNFLRLRSKSFFQSHFLIQLIAQFSVLVSKSSKLLSISIGLFMRKKWTLRIRAKNVQLAALLKSLH